MKPETIQLLKNLGRGLGVLLVVSLLVWATWHVVRLPIFTITEVEVVGGETISHQEIKTEIDSLLEGEYWRFVPRRFAWSYPQQEILDFLTATPRVLNPAVEREGSTVRVTLAEFEPVALWCDSGAASTSSCVFLEEYGLGFASAPRLDGRTFTRFVRVGEPATTSAVYADTTDFAQLRQLDSLLSEYGWPVVLMELDQARDVFVHLAGDSQLKITLRLTPAETLDNLQTVLTADEYQHLEPGNFSYIDLRFGNKVFVNEFGDPTGGSATSSVESAVEIQ